MTDVADPAWLAAGWRARINPRCPRLNAHGARQFLATAALPPLTQLRFVDALRRTATGPLGLRRGHHRPPSGPERLAPPGSLSVTAQGIQACGEFYGEPASKGMVSLGAFHLTG